MNLKNTQNRKVWVLLLNWKNASDTVACLDSILDCDDTEIQGVVLCDNGSNDGSIDDFLDWQKHNNMPLEHIKFVAGEFETITSIKSNARFQFTLIENGENLGFAAGNNIGLNYIKEFTDYDYVFLLNNDTLIQDRSISALVERFEENNAIGLCGSKVIYEYKRDIVQAYGGASFNKWLGRAVDIGTNTNVKNIVDAKQVEKKLDYILGAATMISKACLETVGNMEERYFLYYEEIDWAVRAKQKGFSLAYAEGSIVYHKEGASIGTSYDTRKRSQLSTYYLTSSKVRFAMKMYPYTLPTVVVFSVLQALRALINKDVSTTKTIIKAIFLKPFTN